MSQSRRNHSPAFKAKVALEALKGEQTIHAIAAQHQVHPTQVQQWKSGVEERAAELFAGGKRANGDSVDVAALYAKIGQLTMERDFLSRVLGK